MRGLLVSTVLIASAVVALGADSSQASLRVGVEVTRKCSVAPSGSSNTLDVMCTQDGAALSVLTSTDGQASSPTPLVTVGPGQVGASVPAGTPDAPARVVTIQF